MIPRNIFAQRAGMQLPQQFAPPMQAPLQQAPMQQMQQPMQMGMMPNRQVGPPGMMQPPMNIPRPMPGVMPGQMQPQQMPQQMQRPLPGANIFRARLM